MGKHQGRGGTRWARSLIYLCAIALAAVVVAGCGKTSSTSSSASSSSGATSVSSSSSSAVASTSSGCGTAPTLPIKGDSSLVTGAYKAQYNGYEYPIYKSAFTNFKPKGKPPYTVGVTVTAPISPFQAGLIPQLEKALHGIKGVGKVILLTSPPTGLTTQIEQTNSLIQQHVSVIVTQPLVAQAFIPIAQHAAAAGIPMISIVGGTPSPDVISIEPNSVNDAAGAGAKLAKMIGGKGSVVGVHGVPSTATDKETFAGFSAAFARCSGIKFDTSLVGQFQPSVAKQQMLSYLSSHPQPIAGVVETAGMGPGIIQAFKQTGRPQPVMVDAGAEVGDLVYWKTNPSKLASAYTITPDGVSAATAYVVGRLLGGKGGPKVSALVRGSVAIDGSNLSQYITPGASATDAAAVEGTWEPTSYLAPLFGGK